MYHKISQILNDKSRRIHLSKHKFTFKDTGGDLKLDFENKSIRINHRAAFDQLYRLGGDKLMEKLLAEGNTCLTTDPNAAKSGVYPVAGSDRYFIKTSTYDPSALASIFYGIAGWGEICGNWDEDDIIIEDHSEDDALLESCMKEVTAADDEFVPLFDDEFEPLDLDFTYVPKARYFTIIPNNGKMSLFNRQEKEFLEIFDGDETTYDEFVSLEPITLGDDEIFGYRYQLEEGGKWGYISRGFAQTQLPRYDGIIAANGTFSPMIFAWAKGKSFGSDDEETLTVYYSDSVDLQDADFRDLWLPEAFGSHGGSIYNLDCEYIPYSAATVDEETTDKGEQVMLYSNGLSYTSRVLTVHNEENMTTETWYASYSTGIITLRNSAGKTLSGPAAELNLTACIRLLEFADSELEIIGCLDLVEDGWSFPESGIYIVCKDALYAVAELDIKTRTVRKLLTPFAFTDICKLPKSYVLVDLFGKKGVFNWRYKNYLIPCDYESVEAVNTDRELLFTVKRMGFSGEINEYGNWTETLHR